MKQVFAFLGAVALLAGCQPAPQHDHDGANHEMDSIKQVFEANSATIMALMRDFQNESVDVTAYYADTVVIFETGFGSPKDSLDRDGLDEQHQGMWAGYDFQMVTDPVNLLPGVNPDTKMMDGSVRFYSQWKVTKPGTDSTEERSGVVKLYESFDFNADGKIVYQQIYGDFGGLFGYLEGMGGAMEAMME